MRQLMYQFITNKHALFQKENLLNHQEPLKYYEHDCRSIKNEFCGLCQTLIGTFFMSPSKDSIGHFQ